jgi:hypothetical protein
MDTFFGLKGYAETTGQEDGALKMNTNMRLLKLIEKYYKNNNNERLGRKIIRQIQAVFQGNLDTNPELLLHESSLKILSKIASQNMSPTNSNSPLA